MFKYFHITNGQIDQDFNKDVMTYSVDVDENTTELEFDFEMEMGSSINVVGNNSFTPGENYVFIELVKDDKLVMYKFIVNKEYSSTVMGFDNDIVKLETKGNSIKTDLSPVVVIIYIIVLLILIRLLFFKKKVIRKN